MDRQSEGPPRPESPAQNTMRRMDAVRKKISQYPIPDTETDRKTPDGRYIFNTSRGILVKGIDDPEEAKFNMNLSPKPEDRIGIGSGVVTFTNDFTYDSTIFPQDFPKDPRYMLKLYVHTDRSTIAQAQELLAANTPRQPEVTVFTEFLVGEDAIGKIIYLPSGIQDERTPIREPSDYGKGIVSKLEGGDLELIAHALSLLEKELTT